MPNPDANANTPAAGPPKATLKNSTAVCHDIFYFGFKEWRD